MTEKKPFTVSPDRDEDVPAAELVRRVLREKGLKAVSFVEPGDIAPRQIVVNAPVKEPVKESTTAQFLRELQEEPVKKPSDVKRTEPQRQRIRAVSIPEGFHVCSDPKCAATEILRLRREGERRRTALSRKRTT